MNKEKVFCLGCLADAKIKKIGNNWIVECPECKKATAFNPTAEGAILAWRKKFERL